MMGASERCCEFWQGETDGAYTYRALAELEEETSLAELHRRVAVRLRLRLQRPRVPIAAVSFFPQLSPMIAAAAIAASSLSVVMNANRLRHWRAPVG
ncbi:MAG: hypothetical protein K0R88_2432 [Solirubrobacterales bacterium]|jgi:hypothetical protein|nr:hypothetical protein [Solirubrobacterales bacterium]